MRTIILLAVISLCCTWHSCLCTSRDPCADRTSPSYNETHASRPWHAVASVLSMPHGTNILAFTEKSGCIQLQIDLFTINQALGSVDPTIDIQLRGQLFDLCSTTPAHYSLTIDDKSHSVEILTIPSFDVKKASLVPLSLTGSFKTASYNDQFKLQLGAMSFESMSEPYDQHDYQWHNKIEGTECTLQGHFKDAQNTVQSTRPIDLALSLPDGRSFVFAMPEGISAAAARGENTVLFEHCPCDVKALAAEKKRCNPYNI